MNLLIRLFHLSSSFFERIISTLAKGSTIVGVHWQNIITLSNLSRAFLDFDYKEKEYCVSLILIKNWNAHCLVRSAKRKYSIKNLKS